MIASVKFVDFQGTVRKVYSNNENKNNIVTLGNGSFVVDAIFLANDDINCHVLVGRYTSINNGVKFLIALENNYKNVFNYPFEEVWRQHSDVKINHYSQTNKNQIIIGNDVYIESDVTILGGVVIGNGAIIKAGAVVSENVPPYAIISGNPAKVIDYRFPKEIADELQKIKYWNWSEAKLKEEFAEVGEIETFIADHKVTEVKHSNGKNKLSDTMKTLKSLHESGSEIYCMYADFGVNNPLWKKLLRDYTLRNANETKKALLIIYSKEDKFNNDYVQLKYEMKLRMRSNHSVILLETDESVENLVPELSSVVDKLIVTREGISSELIDHFSDYGTEIISGLNTNVFDNLQSYDVHELKPIMFNTPNEMIISNQINQNFNQNKLVINELIKTGRLEEAINHISMMSSMMYEYNQTYTDDFLEEQLGIIEQILSKKNNYDFKNKDEKVAVFYDAFGFDVRGLATIYLQALVDLGYKILYLTVGTAKGNIPTLEKILKPSNHEIIYLTMRSRVTDYYEICEAICKHKPKQAFLYTTPWDISGLMAFMHFAGKMKRYQVNLTDHAFWLGVNAFDYCLEFRDVGASISTYYRKISMDKLLCQPYYPFIDKSVEFQGYPFDKKPGDIVVFSGGQLYKTIDTENTYYKFLDYFMSKYKNIKFWYAGHGEDAELKKIINKYPGRAYHTTERKDLFALMKNIDIYYCTFPIGGGLMSQYAALAEKIPVYLQTNEILSGILLNDKDLHIGFRDKEKYHQEFERLITDPEYRKQRGDQVKNAVISEEQFQKNLSKIMLKNESNIKLNIGMNAVYTEEFRLTYFERFVKTHLRPVTN